MKHYLKKNWGINSLAVLFGVGSSALTVVLNLVMMQLLQSIFDMNVSRFLFWCVTSIAIWVIALVNDYVETRFRAKAIRKMNNQVREDMLLTLLNKNHQAFHEKDGGEYLSWLTNDVAQIEQNAWEPFFALLNSVTVVAFSFAALVSLHWSLVVMTLITSAIMIFLPRLFQKRMMALGTERSEAQAKAVSKLKDLLGGCDMLRAFGRTGRFQEGGMAASEQIEQAKMKMTCQKSLIGNVMGLVNLLCQMAINIAIGFLSIQGYILQGAIMGGGNLVGSVTSGLNKIANLKLSFSAAKPYFESITVHAGEEKPASQEALPPIETAITLENVNFSYDARKPIVKNASLTFARGGKYALTGPSGCGKSTLLKLLLGWLPDYTGAIRFDGRDARDYTPDQLQRQMSYIEQNVFLFNSTIRDNITLGGDFTDEQMEKALRDSALEGDLKSMPEGLDTPVGEGGSSLSGGQKQRVAIARALIHDRSVLLVDEGTSALDQKNADIVEKSLLANPDLTLILVSHHLSQERKENFTQVYELA